MSYYNNYYNGFDEEGECIVCGLPTQKIEHDFCYECFCEIKDMKYDYFQEYSKKQLANIYNKTLNNAKKDIKNIDIKEIHKQLLAIAEVDDEEYDGYTDLLPHLNKDIEELYNLKSKKDFAEKFQDEDYRKQWPAEFQCDDGHYVRSPYELIIDNWLYHHDIKHEYEKSVFMKKNPDDIVLADFYLPKHDVYIEFWGIEDNRNYEQRKENKIKLYDDNKIKRIDLNKEHIKRLNDILPRLLAKYKK